MSLIQWECLSDTVERDASANITSCNNSKSHEEGRSDPGAFRLKTEELKVLTLDKEKENLVSGRIKVRLLLDFSIDLYFIIIHTLPF